MATAIEVADAALKRILVQAGDAPLEPDEYFDFYDSLNNYMASLEAVNIRLGYTPVDGPNDEVTIPAGALRGVIANMAIEVAPDYSGQVSPALVSQAAAGMTAMRRLGRVPFQSKLPETLPRGSGLEGDAYRRSSFYVVQDSALLSLQGNARATEFTAVNVAAKVDGFWRVEASKGFRGDITGTLQNTSSSELDMDCKVTLDATGNSTYKFSLLRNGSTELTSVTTAVTSTSVTLAVLATVKPGDYLELWVEDTLATEPLTVVNCQFRLS